MDRIALASPRRDYSISIIRVIATISIVCCHIFQYYGIELAQWLNVGVEVFLVISGYLYGKKEITDIPHFMITNIKKILIPAFLWICFVIFLYRVFARESIGLSEIVYPLVYGQTLPGLAHMWFIPYILFCYIITPILYQLNRKITIHRLFWTIVIVLVALPVIYQHIEYSRIVCYIIGWFIGANLHDNKKQLTRLAVLFSVLAVSFNGVRIYFKYFGIVALLGPFEPFFMCYESYCHSLLGIALFLSLYCIFSKLNLGCNFLCGFIDRYSYEIYLTHHVFVLSVISVLSMTNYNIINCLIAVALTLVSSLSLKVVSSNVIRQIDRRIVK